MDHTFFSPTKADTRLRGSPRANYNTSIPNVQYNYDRWALSLPFNHKVVLSDISLQTKYFTQQC